MAHQTIAPYDFLELVNEEMARHPMYLPGMAAALKENAGGILEFEHQHTSVNEAGVLAAAVAMVLEGYTFEAQAFETDSPEDCYEVPTAADFARAGYQDVNLTAATIATMVSPMPNERDRLGT